jgi:FkbM family methyltransferase
MATSSHEWLKALGRRMLREFSATSLPGRSRLRRAVSGILAPEHGIEVLRIGRHALELDHRERATRDMAYGVYEVQELAHLRRLIARGDVVLDVGANVGYMAAHFASMVGPGGRVYAFEPGPRAFGFLERVAASGREPVIRPLRLAVSNRCGTGEFFETDAILATGYGRLDERPSARFQCQVDMIPVTTIDAFLEAEGVTRVNFVKLDVEGQERAAIEGMSRTLAHHRPALLTEVTTVGRHLEDLLAYAPLLLVHGLEPFRIGSALLPADVAHLPPGLHTNLLWLTPDQRKRMSSWC